MHIMQWTFYSGSRNHAGRQWAKRLLISHEANGTAIQSTNFRARNRASSRVAAYLVVRAGGYWVIGHHHLEGPTTKEKALETARRLNHDLLESPSREAEEQDQ